MKKLWGGRFKKEMHPLLFKLSGSLSYDKKLARYDLLGSVAHAKMLGRTKIIPPKDSARIVRGLESLLRDLEKGKLSLSGKYEDIHSLIQDALDKRIGAVGHKLHTARSRNDQVTLDTRLYCREEGRKIQLKLRGLQRVFVELAKGHVEHVIPGYTHSQHAQPVALSHHFLAYCGMLERDKQRIGDALKRMDELPLGSGALAGSSLPIDRFYVARLLGFSRVSQNSLDAVSDRDYVIELLSTVSILSLHLSRMSEEFIAWSSPEFGFLELDDAFCTGSSLMPQKKNPDPLELIRGTTGRIYGNLVSVLVTLKGIPLAYNRDMQLDKEPLFDSIERMELILDILSELLPKVAFHVLQIDRQLKDEGLYAADLVEYLVRKGIAFREAHDIIGHLIRDSLELGKRLSDRPLSDFRKICPRFEKDVYNLMDPYRSVDSKNVVGGTARNRVRQQIQRWERILKNA
ncbi:MAG: argininosuccinate lyase [Candidatus Omnitrophica bacterium]|nr:argininosuccinate lyase [Candidatus Omnitrophota bacterium]